MLEKPTAVPRAMGSRIAAAGCSNRTLGKVREERYAVMVLQWWSYVSYSNVSGPRSHGRRLTEVTDHVCPRQLEAPRRASRLDSRAFEAPPSSFTHSHSTSTSPPHTVFLLAFAEGLL